MRDLSVILPFYNAEKTIERAVTSVLCQSGIDFELILVDDGSTDRSRETVERILGSVPPRSSSRMLPPASIKPSIRPCMTPPTAPAFPHQMKGLSGFSPISTLPLSETESSSSGTSASDSLSFPTSDSSSSSSSSSETPSYLQLDFPNASVFLICQENLGAPAARNHGLSLASGSYVLFLDADDALEEDLFRKLREDLSSGSDLLIGNFRRISRSGVSRIEYKKAPLMTPAGDPCFFLDPYPSAKLYLRSFLMEYGIRFDSLRLAQDLAFYYKALGASRSHRYTEICIAARYETAGSISHSLDDRILDVCRAEELSEAFCRELGISPKRLSYLRLGASRHINLELGKVLRMADPEKGYALYLQLEKHFQHLFRQSGLIPERTFLLKKLKAFGRNLCVRWKAGRSFSTCWGSSHPGSLS